jgi:hypothetical protein
MPPRLHVSIVSVRGPLWLHFKADPDPAFHSHSYLDPASQIMQINADPYPETFGALCNHWLHETSAQTTDYPYPSQFLNDGSFFLKIQFTLIQGVIC